MSVTVELHTLILSLSLFLSLVMALVLYIMLLLRNSDGAPVRAARAAPEGDAQSSNIRPEMLARQRTLASPHERPQSNVLSQNSSISRFVLYFPIEFRLVLTFEQQALATQGGDRSQRARD